MPVPSSSFPPLPPPLQLLLLLLLCSLVLGACTRPNPDFCCTSESECASLGVSELRTCSTGRVCDANVCREVQCDTAEQCTADAPYCADQVCKAVCAGDGDCVGAPGGPLCADDGVCVGCESNNDCTEEAPICSPTKRICSPCRADADCASGVCLAADGVCAKEGALIYVRDGGTDDGNCFKSAPCYTFSHALQLATPIRRVIRLLGPTYVAPSGIGVFSYEVYIDAENTEIKRTTEGPVVDISGTGDMTFEGAKFNVVNQRAIGITRNGMVRLSQIQGTGTGAENMVLAEAGTAEIWDSQFSNGLFNCTRAKLVVEDSEFQNGAVIGSSSCVGELRRNVFNDTRLTVEGGLVFQNNLVRVTSPTCDHQFTGGPVNQVDFNTWVCRRSPPVADPSMGVAIRCRPEDRFTGNLFAWDSLIPAQGCTLRHSLLPSFANPTPGENNQRVNMAEVFIDYLGGDYHLSKNSPAKAAGDPRSTLAVDLEGNPRPNPTGSAPDIGAFEAP